MLRSLTSFAAANAVADVAGNRLVGEQRAFLEHHPDPPFLGGDTPPGGDVAIADDDPPGGRRLEAGDAAQQCRLATSRGAEKGEDLAGNDAERDPVKHGGRPVGGTETFDRDAQPGRHGRRRYRRARIGDMLDHVSIQCADLVAAAAFYDTVLAPLGGRRVLDFGQAIGYGTEFPDFWLGAQQTGDGFRESHIAFTAPDRAAVQAFFDVAVANGAEVLHEPRLWPEYHEHYFGAFVRDPDGNNVEAVCHLPDPTA